MTPRKGPGGAAKSTTADQISQSVQSISNLLRLMVDSSPSHAQLRKLPGNLLAMSSTIKNTNLVLEQLAEASSSLDMQVDRGLESLPHLSTVMQLLSTLQISHRMMEDE
ncbi:hypothetical protein M569_03839 [Genlisea aurea]|uniref:Tobamovirus multiplication protein 2B n=1 Tax=Genlisea aurea TaxID=192259 RepID=S8CVT3_9LAMI|nr:hypothetical protein M569_03839 [Genlisea aurea]